ncbi:uncharacterized protein RJT20DRAFT_63693 [Scheffersomyces xylosifermentans]|uniref:uncharacterized protein n=1 Tax=Scheffersomyces xylosifermentans TaxID=1304137 RepID=UPI00315D960B
MRFTLILIAAFLHFQSSEALFRISPRIKEYSYNVLFKTYNDVRGQVKTVQSFKDVTALDLLRYGVIKVVDTNSVITNDALAENAMAQNYIPIFEKNKKYDLNAKGGKNVFCEFSFKDVDIRYEVTNSLPVGTCRINESSSPSIYTTGWYIEAATGANVKVGFAQIFSIKPSAQLDLSVAGGIGGSLSCTVDGGKTLQFQIIAESVTLGNIKQRMIKVRGDYSYTGGRLAWMDVGEWEDIEDYQTLNRRNIEVACVTDPEFLHC